MKRPHLCWLTAYCLIVSVEAAAQSSNATYALRQELVSSGGGRIGGGNPMQAQVTLGLPAGGRASNSTTTLIGGIGAGQPLTPAPITTNITITGTVDDPAASVMVNGTAATVSGTTFTASNILLVLGPNTIATVATDAIGNQMTKTTKVYLDLPQAKKIPRFSIPVQGTINDAAATVSVNGIAAVVANGTFTASVPLVTGLNTLTANATDAAGNTATSTTRVFVPMPTQPPAMPTVGTVGAAPPAVTTQSSFAIGGTKTDGTSIWVNGQQITTTADATTWTTTLTLHEGDNEFSVIAKDATGTPSAPALLNIVVDNQPPVLTFAPPSKTNLDPVTLHGSVDDSLTRVTINGLVATRTARDFDIDVPLPSLGPTILHVIARSPNGYTTAQDITIVRGTIPTIQTAQPADGAKVYAGVSISAGATASDQDNDPVQYRWLLDGVLLGDWRSSNSLSWTPALSQLGAHLLTTEVRDAYGGSNQQAIDIYVLRAPVQHP